jgi:hypothetical protein
MKVCTSHWKLMRDTIEDRGMGGLVLKSGEALGENIEKELNGEKAHFDPLMSMNTHWWSVALQNGGLYLMGTPEDGANEGHYCPLCEFEKHSEGFVAVEAVGSIADQMRDYAIAENLIARPS